MGGLSLNLWLFWLLLLPVLITEPAFDLVKLLSDFH